MQIGNSHEYVPMTLSQIAVAAFLVLALLGALRLEGVL
ncbi:hypothetical protein LCGC14_2760180 [marine sediment metagenome]|uniref:Uncharacterized protein n=1 Tax=marine sediment metagenome TaxID=412755 RepID=A0A0F9B7Q6_9ZZZZ